MKGKTNIKQIKTELDGFLLFFCFYFAHIAVLIDSDLSKRGILPQIIILKFHVP